MTNTAPNSRPFTSADLKIPTTPTDEPAGLADLRIPTEQPPADCPPRSLPGLSDLRVPTDAPNADCPAVEEAGDDPMSREEIAAGLQRLAERGVSLSGRRGRPVRSQYFLGPRQAAAARLTKLLVAFIVGRPVTQALVVRLALVLLFRTAADALKNPASAAALRQDLEIAQGAE